METISPSLQGQGMLATWRAFFAFLMQPRLPREHVGHRAVFGDAAPGETRAAAPAGFGSGALARVAHLFALDVLLMVPVVLVFVGLEAAGVTFPESALEGLEMTLVLIGAVVLGAPLIEELAFRGWLTGRPAALLGFGTVALAYLATSFVVPELGKASQAVASLASLAVPVLIGVLAYVWLRGRAAPGWYDRAFPLFFAVSTLGFAAIHLLNYEQGDLPLYALLPLVIPQALAGLVWGYARVTLGLWSSMLLHALHNGTAVGLILLFGDAIR